MNKIKINKQIIMEWMLSIQHLFAMFGATVLVPILVGINPSVAIFTAGIGTLIFHLCTKGKVPVFLGSSFAFISPMIAVATTYGYEYVQGGIVVVGLIYCILAFIVYKIGTDKIAKLLPPHVVGAMIIIIGVTLIPSAINNITTNVLVALVTLGVSVFITIFGKGFVKQMGILLGVIVGFVLSSILGVADFSALSNASIIALPISFSMPKFSLEAILIIAPLSLATVMEHVGDITTNGTVVGKNFVKDPGLHRTLLGDGLATLFAGLCGSAVNTTYGENTSLLAITKNYNPKLLRRTAVIAIVLSFIGVFGALLQSIPACVIGGISLQLYCMIAYIGVKNIVDHKSYCSVKNCIIIGIMLLIGLGGLIGINISVAIGCVTLSGLSLSAIVGILLNALLSSSLLNK